MNSYKIFCAGPWLDRPQMQAIATKLQEAGHTITSRWVFEHPDLPPTSPGYLELVKEQAMQDIEDLAKAEVMVYLNSRMSEGKATELGMAMLLRIPILVIGKAERNIYLKLLPETFETVEQVIEMMATDDEEDDTNV